MKWILFSAEIYYFLAVLLFLFLSLLKRVDAGRDFSLAFFLAIFVHCCVFTNRSSVATMSAPVPAISGTITCPILTGGFTLKFINVCYEPIRLFNFLFQK